MRIVLTGGTSGIGREVAIGLGAKGHQVDVVGGTNEEKGRALAEEFEPLPGTLRFFPVDLSEPGSIRSFIESYTANNSSLDAVFANAGYYVKTPAHGPSGLERGFVVNYLHKFMMLVAMHPLLAASGGQCVINGTSNFARNLDLTPHVFARNYKKNMTGMMQATYANAYLSYWFNRKFGTEVRLQSVNPGFVKTGMMKQASVFVRALQSLFGISPQQAASHIVPVVDGSTFNGEHSTYIDQGKSKSFSSGIRKGEETFDRLWKISLELSGLASPFQS